MRGKLRIFHTVVCCIVFYLLSPLLEITFRFSPAQIRGRGRHFVFFLLFIRSASMKTVRSLRPFLSRFFWSFIQTHRTGPSVFNFIFTITFFRVGIWTMMITYKSGFAEVSQKFGGVFTQPRRFSPFDWFSLVGFIIIWSEIT